MNSFCFGVIWSLRILFEQTLFQTNNIYKNWENGRNDNMKKRWSFWWIGNIFWCRFEIKSQCLKKRFDALFLFTNNKVISKIK